MKIQLHVNEVIDADVSIEEVIEAIVERETPQTIRDLSGLLGNCVKMLSLVPDELIQQLNPSQLEIICGALRTQLERYASAEGKA